MARAGTYPVHSALATAAEGVLPDPLDHFAEEHLRQREICGMLDTIAAAARPDRAVTIEALRHLTTALPRHLHDEEQGLFPSLRHRSEPDDEINDTLDRLDADHAKTAQFLDAVIAALGRIAGSGGALTAEEAETVTGFAAHERRHLIVENAIVLPLARVRLTAGDLDALRQAMVLRRAPDTNTDSTGDRDANWDGDGDGDG